MAQTPELINVTMIRETLEGIPDLPMPAPYKLRNWRPGDETAFDDIWLAADACGQAKRGLFAEEFSAHVDAVPERMFFIIDAAGRPVGTATAWWNPSFGAPGENWGVVHWVAVIPQAQGKGLSKPLMTAVLRRMKALGHERACLVTQTVRLVAIALYRSLGFKPLIRNDADAAAWREVDAGLARMRR